MSKEDPTIAEMLEAFQDVVHAIATVLDEEDREKGMAGLSMLMAGLDAMHESRNELWARLVR